MGKKILVVEDDLDYSGLLQRVLTEAGFAVKVLNDPGNLVEKVSTEKPDLIFLDIVLPKVSGLTLLEDLKKEKKTKDIPVFCLTNLPEEVGQQKAIDLGAHSYLTKAHYNIYDVVKHAELFFKEQK